MLTPHQTPPVATISSLIRRRLRILVVISMTMQRIDKAVNDHGEDIHVLYGILRHNSEELEITNAQIQERARLN